MATKTQAVQTAPVTKNDDKTPAMTKVVENLKEQTTSAKIRGLNAAGFSRSEIAKFLGKRYQHVRNVLITPIGKKGE